jgi:imidazolonepropionase-like amidohydrolase
VTTIVTAPSHGIFNGQSAIVNLGSGPIDRASSRVRGAAGLVQHAPGVDVSRQPHGRDVVPAPDVSRRAAARRGDRDLRKVARRTRASQENPGLDALRPVLRRELPVVFVADTELMIRRAMTLAREWNVQYVLSGARQGYAMPAELKNVPVLVSVRWPVAPADKEDREEQPLRVIRDRQLAPSTPSVLAKNGVAFALVSGAGKTGDFLPGIRKAIENGLSAEDALRPTTLTPARIFGVDRQLGSSAGDRGSSSTTNRSSKKRQR